MNPLDSSSRSDSENDASASRLLDVLSTAEEVTSSPGDSSPISKLPRASKMDSQSDVQSRQSARALAGERLIRAFWTVTGVVSLLVNAVLITLMVIVGNKILAIKEKAGTLGAGMVSGLYINFEKMDRAHIKTTISVDKEVPVKLMLPIQTSTTVRLTESTTIPGAHVRINTTLFNIDAPATVTLPKDTSLPVFLDAMVPVETTISIHLEIPVDISLAATDLHEPFVGMLGVFRPLICALEPNAKSVDGTLICK